MRFCIISYHRMHRLKSVRFWFVRPLALRVARISINALFFCAGAISRLLPCGLLRGYFFSVGNPFSTQSLAKSWFMRRTFSCKKPIFFSAS